VFISPVSSSLYRVDFAPDLSWALNTITFPSPMAQLPTGDQNSTRCDVLIIGAVYQAFLQLIIFLTTTPLLHPLCSWKLEKFAPEQQGGMVQVTLISQWQLAEICKVAT